MTNEERATLHAKIVAAKGKIYEARQLAEKLPHPPTRTKVTSELTDAYDALDASQQSLAWKG